MACIRLKMRRLRLARLYPRKSKLRRSCRYSRSASSSPLLGGVDTVSLVMVDAYSLHKIADQAAKYLGPLLRGRDVVAIAGHLRSPPAALHPGDNAPGQVGPLVEGHDGGPERRLDRGLLAEQEVIRGELVADSAPVAPGSVVIVIPQRPAAFRAGQRGRLPRITQLDRAGRRHNGLQRGVGRAREPVADPVGEGRDRADELRSGLLDGRIGHSGERRLLRVLNQGQ